MKTRMKTFLLTGLMVVTTAAIPLEKSRGEDTVDDNIIAFKDVTVHAMTGAPARQATVVVTHGRISAVADSPSFEIPAGARIVEARGRYLLPGLWDMHVHVLFEGIPETVFSLLIANGVTGVRDMNGTMPLADAHQLRERIARGEILGPRFVAAGQLIDGAGRGAGAMGPQVVSVATPEEARKAVRSLKERGADFIKIYNRITPILLQAIAEEARIQGLPFAGHVPHSVSAFAASDAGQSSMEHLQNILESVSSQADEILAFNLEMISAATRGERPTAEAIGQFRKYFATVADTYDESRATALFERLKKNRNWQCPTLVSNRALFLSDIDDNFAEDPRLKYLPASITESWSGPNPRQRMLDDADLQRRRFRKLLAVVNAMNRHGVPMILGTDLGASYVLAGFSVHDELALLVEAGVEPQAALLMATRNPAEFLGRAGDLGTIEEGKIADLVLLDANPLLDIANTRQIAGVVVNGRFLDRSELDGLLGNAEAKASYGSRQ